MAYRDRQSISCQSCGYAGALTWVVGVGPHTKAGDPPAYVRILEAGPWIIKVLGKATQVFCPNCDALVTERAP